MSVNSRDGGNNQTPPKSQPFQRRRTPLQIKEKKIGEDEFMAAAIGDAEWLKQSIRGNRGVINYDKNGLSPLHLASIHGRLECMRLMIEKFKVDINLPSQSGWRPIHLVISNQTGKRAFNSLTYLLEQGADLTVTNDDGITPLHQAASEGHVQCLKALVECGAPADGTDYRGHTAMDLAKLWGHRKCARLLAAEKWHREKRKWAEEMSELQKMEMQKMLREIEADEENEAHKKFYGDIAFSEWLEKRGLEPKPTGPKPLEKYEEEETIEITAGKQTKNTGTGDGLYHANSLQPKPIATTKPPSPIREETADSLRTTTRGSSGKSIPRIIEPLSRESTKSNVVVLEPQEKPSDDKPVVVQVGIHPHDWIKSTKTVEMSYVPILGDHYPRDEYSMSPKYSPKRQVRTPTPSGKGDGDKSPENSPNERPVVYKCKHIGDVHKKKHYDAELLPRAEVGMHLCADPNSEIFRSALLPPVRSGSRKRKPGSRPESFDLQSIMSMMERMGGTSKYFPIQGSKTSKSDITLEA